MEVKLDKRYPIQASLDQAWAVLSDIHATAACMPGAQITEQVDATHYKGTVKSKVGPATMLFQGDIDLQGIDTEKRELRMVSKGADRGGSTAAMQLHAHLEPGEGAGDCVLVGAATVTVSGKLAQFGSRLLVPVSDAMLAQFADNFRASAAAVPLAAAAPDSAGTSAAAGGLAEAVVQSVASEAGASQPAGAGSASTGTLAAGSAAHATPAAPRPALPVKELNALSLLWAVIRGWFAGLFGRRT
jgi:uncharacterized protein